MRESLFCVKYLCPKYPLGVSSEKQAENGLQSRSSENGNVQCGIMD